jgi:glycosyltransferase involved in cell wall biosynthesis
LTQGIKGKTVAAVMIVRDEEAMLPRCLESLRDFPLVVILDTGSTDRTEVVALSFPNVLFIGDRYEWEDDDSGARNFGLKFAEEVGPDWLYTIDADEYLGDGAFVSIFQFIKKASEEALAMDVELIAENSGNLRRHRQPRLFRNHRKIGYSGMAHPVLCQIDFPTPPLPVLGEGLLPVKHTYSYSPNHAKDPDRYIRMLNKAIEREGRTSRNLFYLAREWVYRQDWARALTLYSEYLNHQGSRWAPEINEARLQLARCLWHLNSGDEARRICMQVIGANPAFKAALELMAEMTIEAQSKYWRKFVAIATNENVLFG